MITNRTGAEIIIDPQRWKNRFSLVNFMSEGLIDLEEKTTSYFTLTPYFLLQIRVLRSSSSTIRKMDVIWWMKL